MTDRDELQSIAEIESTQEALEKRKIKNPSMLGKVNMTRLIKDWNELVSAMKKNLAYPIKHQRIYPYLLDDFKALPIEPFMDNPMIELPCGICLNVLLFKSSFDDGLEDVKEQIKNQRQLEKPAIVHLDDLIDGLEYSEGFKQLMKYTFRFAFNKEKEKHPYIKKTDVVFEEMENFICMKIQEKIIARMNLDCEKDDDLFLL